MFYTEIIQVRTLIQNIKSIVLISIFGGAFGSVNAQENMTIEYVPYYQSGNFEVFSHIFLEGPVDFNLPTRLQEMLDKHPDVSFIQIGKSPGGALYGGIDAAKVIRDSGLALHVSGPVASAAAVMSTGASTSIIFAYDEGLDYDTQVLFHCAYIRGSDTCDEKGTLDAANTLEQLTPYSSEWWFDFLMLKTTPQTVEAISLNDLFSNWDCVDLRGQRFCDAARKLSAPENCPLGPINCQNGKSYSFANCAVADDFLELELRTWGQTPGPGVRLCEAVASGDVKLDSFLGRDISADMLEFSATLEGTRALITFDLKKNPVGITIGRN